MRSSGATQPGPSAESVGTGPAVARDVVRLCATCGVSLAGRRRHARFCSGACRAAAARQPSAGESAQKRTGEAWHPLAARWFIVALRLAFPGSVELEDDGGRLAGRPRVNDLSDHPVTTGRDA